MDNKIGIYNYSVNIMGEQTREWKERGEKNDLFIVYLEEC